MAEVEGLSMEVVAESEGDARDMVRMAMGNMGLRASALIYVGPLEPGVWEFVVDAAAFRALVSRSEAKARRFAPVGGDAIAALYAPFGKLIDA